MNARLSKKASSHEYGYLYKELVDFRIGLGPLIDNKMMVKGLIDRVLKHKISITNEKDFSA